MKTKNLVLMILALLALIGLARWSQRSPARAPKSEKPLKLVAFDINAADRFTVTSAGQTAVVAKAAAGWLVENLWGYPANFDTMTEHLRRLAQLEGLEVRGGEATLDEFGLDPASTSKLDRAVVTFTAAGKTVGRVTLGSPRLSRSGGEGYPDGQYVRAEGGPVLVTKEFLAGFPRRPQDWADMNLVNVSRADIDYVMVQAAGGEHYGLFASPAGPFELTGLATGETTKAESADAVAGALQNLTWVNLLDPKTPAAASGLDKAATYVAHLKSGLSYTLKVGGVSTQDNGRIVQVSVAYEKPEAPAASITTNAEGKVTDVLKAFESTAAENAKKAAADNARLSPWIYVLSDYVAGNLVKPRAELIQAVTNAPAAAAAAVPPATPAVVPAP